MEIKIIKDDEKHNDELYAVITKAFKQDDEAHLVQTIKDVSEFYISYLAITADDKVVGHVLISPMLLNGKKDILALAPVSVLDEYQNLGVGGRLIRTAIKDARQHPEYKAITVLGSDHYYKKFDFVGYNPDHFKLPFEIEEPRYYQVLELESGFLKENHGNFDYPAYFGISKNER